jgi:tetratricopeptide (TPR) repeat protein
MTIALEAKLAMAEKDRPRAVAAAKKLMPSGPVPLEQVPQLRSTGKLMEDLGFPKAADKVLQEFAARSIDGIVARVEFLGRQKRPEEALDTLDAAWDRLPLERTLQTAVVVVRSQSPEIPPAISSRVEKWFSKARRLDPDSVVIGLLHAELQEIMGRTEAVESMYRDLLARENLAPTQRAVVANNLAFHLAKKDTAKEALELVDSAIEELGPHPDLLDTRGVVELELGNVPRAIADLREASLVPTPVKLLHLAAAQAAGNQLDAAKRTLEEARRIGLSPQELQSSDKRRLEQLDAAIGTGDQPVSIRDRASASSAS